MLLGNYNQWNANPGRAIGGPTNPTLYFKRSTHNNFFFPNDGTNIAQIRKAATPTGYRHPYAYVMPIDPGGIAAINTLLGGSSVAGANLAGGLNAVAALSGSGSLTATMQLIVSAVAVITATGGLTGNINAIAPLAAALAGGGSLTATLQALGNAVAALTASGSFSSTIRATGTLEALVTSQTELSPESLAAAVWSAVAAEFNAVGTMGEKLNSAGGGSSPADIADAVWDEILSGHTTSGSSAQIVKAIKALVAAGL